MSTITTDTAFYSFVLLAYFSGVELSIGWIPFTDEMVFLMLSRKKHWWHGTYLVLYE